MLSLYQDHFELRRLIPWKLLWIGVLDYLLMLELLTPIQSMQPLL